MAIIIGILLAWSTNVNLTVKAIRFDKGALGAQTRNRLLLQFPQGYQLQVGRSPAHAPRDIDIAISKIRALIAFRR